MIVLITNVNPRALDLNLLGVLVAVIDEGSVTRAARKLEMTQPAVSNALRRLRRELGDPLVVRGPRGVVPTAHALRLAAPMREALERLRGALDTGAFDSSRAERTFTIASSDYGQLTALPRVLPAIEREAPRVRLRFVPFTDAVWEGLVAGEIDLALGRFDRARDSYVRQKLYTDEMLCVARANHPRVRGQLPIELFVELKHVLIAPFGGTGGMVDEALAREGLRREVALFTTSFALAPVLVACTDWIATIPRRVARAFGGRLSLQELPPPVSLPGFTMSQLWHRRTERDEGHRWLRAAIHRALRDGGARE